MDDMFVMFRRMTIGLGTFVSIEVCARANTNGPALLDAACAVFETVDATMHPTREGSDLLAIARAAAGEVVHVQADTFEVLTLARRLWVSSSGVFDPCLPDQPGRMGDLALSGPGQVRRGSVPVALDLGGIAKGFAVDRAVERLRAGGGVSGLVNAGGDVRVFGSERHPIQIRAVNGSHTEISLENEALAVSGPRSAQSPSEHRGFYSRLDGRAVAASTVAVRAPTASVADALTKCAMLCAPTALDALLLEYGAKLVDTRLVDI